MATGKGEGVDIRQQGHDFPIHRQQIKEEEVDIRQQWPCQQWRRFQLGIALYSPITVSCYCCLASDWRKAKIYTYPNV